MRQFSVPIAIFIALFASALASCGRSGQANSQSLDNAGFTIRTIASGKGTGSVEVADFNKDNFPDIVVANAEDSSVDVFLNDGKGNFARAGSSPFFVNKHPNDIAIADFNRDGNLDLFVANTEVSMLTVLSGDGKGSFRQIPHSPFSLRSKPHTHGIAVADFNGDGNLDLATDDWGENKITIIFGDGPGNFLNQRFYDVGKRPYQRLRSGDLNRDGHPDIVTTNLEGANSTVLLGDGNGNFHQPPGSPFDCGDAPFGVAIGDVNGDGNPDLAITDSPTITSANKGKDGLWILLGDGKGNFLTARGSPFKTGKSPSRVAIGDLDSNGINDIATTNYNDKSISIFYMNHDGLELSKVISVGNRPDGIAIRDMNGDGKNDMVVSNQDDNTIMILFAR